ncbi:uncharacterized protein METZ01_LOCUS189070, partial [marine metagenome]|jgi:hypothetical protein|tara:strand:+ start:847 stop:1428 length:582 start_codon:yes stop_codon:yes gene_type:complete
VAVVDVAGFIADLKDHAAEHGFHVHDERHFVETYSMRQAFEVDLHPEAACGGPLDLHLSLDLEPRTLMAFEDEVMSLSEEANPSDDLTVQILFTWALPPLENGPDLLVLATELAGLGGTQLPTEVSAMDSFAEVTDAPQRSINVVARIETPLAGLYSGDFRGEERNWVCDALDRCQAISEYLLDRAPAWLGEA